MSTERVSVPWKTHGFVWASGSVVFTVLWWAMLFNWTNSTGNDRAFLVVAGLINAIVIGVFLFYLITDLLNAAVENGFPVE